MGTCGLKKGFLSAAPKKKKSAKSNSSDDDMEVLRPKGKPQPKGKIEGFEIPQHAIDVSSSQVSDVLQMGQKSPDEWMTPELLQAIMKEPDLIVAMQDPKMQAVIAEVGADPTAIEKYKHDKKLMKFYETYIRLASIFFQKSKQGK